jgi:uncharacterized protein
VIAVVTSLDTPFLEFSSLTRLLLDLRIVAEMADATCVAVVGFALVGCNPRGILPDEPMAERGSSRIDASASRGRGVQFRLSRGAAMLRVLAVAAALIASTSAAAGEPLFDAVKAGDAAGVEHLLAKGAEIDARTRDQATPLMAAALSDQPAVAELLLAKGADVMARNSGGFTPLHAAAYSGSVRIAELLLDKGAVLEDTANKAGVTPLMVAVEENRAAMLELLIARGADVNRPESHGYTPVTRAGFKGHRDIIRVLKRHGAACPPAEVNGAWLCIEMRD